MQVDFFNASNGFDKKAIHGGIYQVELIMKSKVTEPISLYIGESVWIAVRCAQHLYSVFENPMYFGLSRDDLENDDLILKFKVLDSVEDKKSLIGVGRYKQKELEYIKKLEPLTQLDTSDRQLKDNKKKYEKVQKEMEKRGYKIQMCHQFTL